jgi:DNA-binding MarR family transcriptional regulator
MDLKLQKLRESGLPRLLLQVRRGFLSRVKSDMQQSEGYPFNSLTGSALPFIDLGGTRLTDLAKKMGVSKQATSKTVKELEALGLIQQSKIPSDQRMIMIEFTPEGISYMKKLHKSIKKAEMELALQIGDKEFEQLRCILKKSLDFYQEKHH